MSTFRCDIHDWRYIGVVVDFFIPVHRWRCRFCNAEERTSTK